MAEASVSEIAGEVAANQARAEADRFDPQFMYELRAERDRQIRQWGDDHDRTHVLYDWTVFLSKFVGRAAEAAMDGNGHEFDRQMVKVAALAAAARRANYPADLLASHAEQEANTAQRKASDV